MCWHGDLEEYATALAKQTKRTKAQVDEIVKQALDAAGETDPKHVIVASSYYRLGTTDISVRQREADVRT